MILHWDGSSPLIMLFVMLIVYFAYRKDRKENDKAEKKLAETKANLIDFEKALDAIYDGATSLKKDGYKHLKERDLKYLTDTHGVKFV